MSIADAILAQLLPPCPLCSYRKADHPELSKDVLAMPMAQAGRAGGRYYLRSGCVHSDRLQPKDSALGWPSKDEAEQAWRDEVARLEAEHQRTCAELAASVARELDRRRLEDAHTRLNVAA